MIDGLIGGFALGEAEAELENLASLPSTPAQAKFYRRRWRVWFKRRGAVVVYRRNLEGAAPLRITTRAFFRHLKDAEMIGPVRASDVSIIIDPAPLKAQGLQWPPMQGDMAVRRSGRPEETLYAAIAPPQVVDVSDVDIVIRMIARTGAAV